MIACLEHVAKRERFTLPSNVADKIVEDCEGNVRKAILMLEALKMQSSGCLALGLFPSNWPHPRPDLSGPISIAKPDWETYCNKVADMIMQEQSAQRILDVRAKLYELLAHCIPPTVILKVWSWGISCSVLTFFRQYRIVSSKRLMKHWSLRSFIGQRFTWVLTDI